VNILIGHTKNPKSKWSSFFVVIGVILLIIFVFWMWSLIISGQSEIKTEVEIVEVVLPTSTTIIASPVPAVGNIAVEKIIFTKGVTEDNQPTDNIVEIPKFRTPRLYCYTQVNAEVIPQVIYHAWIAPDGKQIADIGLTVKSQPAHTWSYIDLAGQKSGSWKVEIRDSSGNVLATKELLLYE